MYAELVNRYLWLINTLKDNRLTFREISDKWENASINEKKDCLPERTFRRHRKAISLHWKLDFDFHKTDNTYGIKNIDDLHSNAQLEWMLSSFSVMNMLKEGSDMEDWILFERIPKGADYLVKIVDAIKTKQEISFVYNKFGSESGKFVEGAPYCLKINKQRWYVLLRNKENQFRTYALDRISDISISDVAFSIPEDFSAKEYFKHSVGIYVYEDKPVETVRIEVSGIWVNLLRTLPLHHSQQETVLNNDTSVFEYRIRTDVEFISELLKMGESVKVLEPQTLVDEMKEKMRKMMKIYGMK